jgi:hypothetical protein
MQLYLFIACSIYIAFFACQLMESVRNVVGLRKIRLLVQQLATSRRLLLLLPPLLLSTCASYWQDKSDDIGPLATSGQ